MPVNFVRPLPSTSVVTAKNSYIAWATELGLSTTATIQSLNMTGDSWASFQLDSACKVSGATYAQFSSQGLIGWSASPKLGLEQQTDYWSVSYSNGQPDMMIGMRLISSTTPWMTSSRTKLQKAGGFTIIFGRLTLDGEPTNYFEFAIRFSPVLLTNPELIITSQSSNVQISYVRADPAILPQRFSSVNLSLGSFQVVADYVTLAGRIVGNSYLALHLSQSLTIQPRILIPNSIDNTNTGPANLRLPSPSTSLLGGRFISADPVKRDVYFGGDGTVEGFVTVDGIVSQRNVTLYDRATKLVVGSQMSQPNGKFRFTTLDKTCKYFVLGDYGSETRESIVRDRITFEDGVEVQDIPAFITPVFPSIVPGVFFTFTPGLTSTKTGVVWSISSGALPVGLTLDATTGTVSGTTSDGTTQFTLRATYAGAYSQQDVSGSADIYFDNVSLLLHGIGEDNSTNIVDNSTFPKVPTLYGSARTSKTVTQFGGAILLSGGSALVYPYSSDFHLDSDFTIEMFFYPLSFGGMLINAGGGLNIAWASYEFNILPTGAVNFAASSANNGYDIGSETGSNGTVGMAVLNAWNHVAVTRQGNVYRGFMNGVEGYEQTTSLTPYDAFPRGLAIGGNFTNSWNTGTPSTPVNCYVAGVRVTRNVPRYISNFTVPSTPAPNTGTTVRDELYFATTYHINGRGIDGDTVIVDRAGGKVAQRVGDVRLSNARSKFFATSIAFNGSGSMLSYGPDINHSLPGDFTIDGWLYPVINTTSVVLSHGGGVNIAWPTYSLHNQTFGLVFGMSSANNGYDIGDPDGGTRGFNFGILPLNKWSHFLISRQGDVFRGFLNGTLVFTHTASLRPYSSFGSRGLTVGGLWQGSYGNGSPYAGWQGAMQDIKITRGYARQTAAFAVPILPAMTRGQALTTGYFDRVSLVVTGDTVVSDRSSFGNTLEVSTNVAISNNAPSFAASSLYFSGSGSSLRFDVTEAFNLSDEDFTIEMFVRPTNPVGYQCMLQLGFTPGAYIYLGINTGSAGQPFLWMDGVYIASNTNFTMGVWQHWALVRRAGVAYMYLNGLLVGSSPFAVKIAAPYGITLGTPYNNTQNYSGWMTCRITKGMARYLEPFTPPVAQFETMPFPARYSPDIYFDNVSLMHFDGLNASTSIVDVTGKTWTSANGAALSQTWSAFGGASLSLGGSKWVSTPQSTDFDFGSGDFTISLIINLRSNPGTEYAGIICKDDIAATRGWLLILGTGTDPAPGYLSFTAFIGATAYTVSDTVVFPINTPTHVVISRDNGRLRLYKGGVQVTSTIIAGSINAPVIPAYIGALVVSGVTQGGRSPDGFVDEVYVSKKALYPNGITFTPPTVQFEPAPPYVWTVWPITATSTTSNVRGAATVSFSSSDSSLLVSGSSQDANFAVLGSPAFGLDGAFEAEFDMVFTSDPVNRKHIGVFIGTRRNVTRGYLFATLDSVFTYYKCFDGNASSLGLSGGTAPPDMVIGNQYTFRITRTAAFEFNVWLNGVFMGSMTDSTYDLLLPGVYVYGASIKLTGVRYMLR